MAGAVHLMLILELVAAPFVVRPVGADRVSALACADPVPVMAKVAAATPAKPTTMAVAMESTAR